MRTRSTPTWSGAPWPPATTSPGRAALGLVAAVAPRPCRGIPIPICISFLSGATPPTAIGISSIPTASTHTRPRDILPVSPTLPRGLVCAIRWHGKAATRNIPEMALPFTINASRLRYFNALSCISLVCTALRFDPESMRRSPAGTTAVPAGGRPIASGRSFSTRNAMPDRFAENCESCAHAMPNSSMSKPPVAAVDNVP